MAKIVYVVTLAAALLLYACSYCSQHIAPLDFKGVVKAKYFGPYKNLPIIVVDSDDKEIMFGPKGRDTLSLYTHLQIGDSLIKRKGYYDFKVVRNGIVYWYTMKCD